MADSVDFDPDLLREAVKGQLIGSEIVFLTRTSSTNDEAWRRAQVGAAEGLVLFADEQTTGRGQRGNHWESPAGKALLFSILLRPLLAPAQSHRLTDWAARAVAAAIRQLLSLPATIKPPNDIYIDQGKVGGVLVEMRAQEGQAHLAIVGIGLNVNQQPKDFSPVIRPRAVSLAMAAGREIDRQTMAIALLRELERSYAPALAR